MLLALFKYDGSRTLTNIVLKTNRNIPNELSLFYPDIPNFRRKIARF